MARPMFFISSTFYDLRIVRDDIARALKELGYDSIRNEVGAISYPRAEKLENSCYREIDNCDVLICIIGGRFGSTSSANGGSITQNELRTAYQSGKQVLIFVERNVQAEKQFWAANREVENLKLTHVTDKRVFQFIEEVERLPLGNPMFAFETSADLIALMKEQLAALFKTLLVREAGLAQRQLFDELKSSIATVGELATFLSNKASEADGAVQGILLIDHPIFAELKTKLKASYRLFFTDVDEFTKWVSAARSMNPVEEPETWDSPDYMEWLKWNKDNTQMQLLKIWKGVFDEAGRLKHFTKSNWKPEYVLLEERAANTDPDDIPF